MLKYTLPSILAAPWGIAGLNIQHDSSFEALCNGLNKKSTTDHLSFIITNATYVPTTAFNVTGELNTAPFCQISATVPYVESNFVLFEVWLPQPPSYNGRFLAVGNGGMAGTIDESALMAALNQGYACAGGDSGHLASENNGGEGEPGVYLPYLHDRKQTLAWIHNSIAYFTPPAKAIVEKAYGDKPRYAYYQGCSTGGAQGFALAQYHPHLFDGIVAGSPGNWYSHLALSFLWNYVDNQNPAYMPQKALDLITQSALDMCDALDGVVDGVIENPLVCDFQIESLECPNSADGASSDPCLTTNQMAQAKRIYDGPRNARTGLSLYPGFSIGSETEWAMQQSQLANAFTIPILQNLVFDDLSYNESLFNWATDVDAVNQNAGTLIDEISVDLSVFRDRGGKFVVTQGWADPYNAAVWPISHREQLKSAMNGNLDDWYALFMVPGGGHCGAASNYPQVPADWHSLDSLVGWVEFDQKPMQMLSTNPSDGTDRTRKLCPWPATAKYLGGNVDDWASYSCRL